MALYTEYIPVIKSPNNSTHIKFQISFNKDTHHWATSSTKKVGYQLTATPVQRSKSECGKFSTESFTAFQGFYKIIYPIARQSKKRLEEAISVFIKEKESYLKFFTDKKFEIEENKQLN